MVGAEEIEHSNVLVVANGDYTAFLFSLYPANHHCSSRIAESRKRHKVAFFEQKFRHNLGMSHNDMTCSWMRIEISQRCLDI